MSRDMDASELFIYIQGLKDGVYLYAWWKDGIQYVGTCGTTLKEAIRRIEKEYEDKKPYGGMV